MNDTTHHTPRSVNIAELPSLVGSIVGTSQPISIPQERIDAFAEATEDRQWLHTDPQKAKDGPFGSTIAHGYLTLSLSTALLWDVLQVSDAGQVVNYGLDKVRFPAPVPAGSDVSMSLEVLGVDEIEGGVQLRYRGTATVTGQEKPVCVAEGIFRYYQAQP